MFPLKMFLGGKYGGKRQPCCKKKAGRKKEKRTGPWEKIISTILDLTLFQSIFIRLLFPEKYLRFIAIFLK
jgi:hypothetical protein